MSDIEIEIDGKKLTAQPNQMVMQVADAAGIYIPRFCYHKHLSIAANCRMCLVEVEKAPKTLPACATPVTPGMKVFTKSPKAIASQKAVMEFLLINHPLDCPICDQGGECELQDLAMGFGSAKSHYCEGKRAVADEDLGPLIATEMTRCIQCTRCVRFGDEIAGLRELGMINRGEHSEVSTYVEKAMHSEVSGNIIDICPVGALTSKPFRFTARAWELDQHPSISPHDCLGSNLNIHTRYGVVMRTVPRENDLINQTWISDRDRFSYQGLYHPDRLAKPMLRMNEKWHEVDWQTALEFVVDKTQKIIEDFAPEQIGGLASANATLEELYLFQKLLRKLGVPNIDHRLRQQDFHQQHNMPAFPGISMPVADMASCDVVLLCGSNIQKEQPVAALRLRQAFLKGAKIMAVNMMDYKFSFDLAARQIVAPQKMTSALAKIAKALLEISTQTIPTSWKTFFADVVPAETDIAMAKLLSAGKKPLILLGALALNHEESSRIYALTKMIAHLCHTSASILSEGANSAGAWLAGVIPHRQAAAVPITHSGLDARTMLEDARRAYFLLNVEPEFDMANSMLMEKALANADLVVSLSMFKNPVLEKHADVILPITPFTETSGTFVNATGTWQSFQGVATPFGDARPAWKILRVLGNLFQFNDFEYAASTEVRDEIHTITKSLLVHLPEEVTLPTEKFTAKPSTQLQRIGEIPIYAGDSLVRRSPALQAAQFFVEGETAAARINPQLANKLKLQQDQVVVVQQNENKVLLPVIIDARVPDDAVLVAGGISATKELSGLFGEIQLIQKM